MFEISADESGRTITMSYSHHVVADEMRRCLGTVRDVLDHMQPGFQLLTDLSGLDSMETACAFYVGEIMNLCNEKKIKSAVCVIPDTKKDIGYDLLSLFHYGPEVRSTTYDNLAEAIMSLAA